MSAMLTADWFLLGRDTYYRKFEICPMEWQRKVNMDSVLCVGAQYGGPIAVIRDKNKFVRVQNTGKPVIAVFSGSGVQTSSLMWSRAGQIIMFGWTDKEDLLCVQDDGNVVRHDMFGSFQHTFAIGQDIHNIKVMDAKIFSSVQGTGVAVLTSQQKVFLVNNVYDPKKRQLSELPRSDVLPSCWAVISGERHTEVLLARNKNLYLLRQDEQQSINVVPDVTNPYTAILEIAVSINAKHIVLYTDSGHLWLGSVDLRTKYCEVATEHCPRPKQLMWCENEAVIASWDTTVLIVGKQGEAVSYAYDGAVCFVPEIDGVRILSTCQHEMIQKVPTVVQKIFRINSTDPGSFLLEASKQYQRRSHRADEYVSLVKKDLKLAVQQCIEAAGYEFDPDVQKMLVRAAQFGKCFLTDVPSDTYVNMCRILRVLNEIRNSKIGMPLTYIQLQYLTCKVLLDRLVARKHYCLAIEIAKYLKLPDADGTSRILSHWANYKVTQTHLEEEVVAKKIADKLGHAPGVSFSEITMTSAACGRKQLAIKLLDYEPRASRQVPLLLQLEEVKPALLKAIESGDTDLMYIVILHMRENMPVADFRLMIRNFPVAQALYKKYCKEHNPQALLEIYIQEDDFAAQAAGSLKESLDPKNSLTKDALLAGAQDAYRKVKNDLYTSLCDEAQRLSKAQKNYADVHQNRNFIDLSVHDTCALLLSLNDIKSAEKFRAEFRIPDRRYWWLRVRSLAKLQEWKELEKLSRTRKPPTGYGLFVDVCLENQNQNEAVKYLSRVSDDLKVKYYVKAGLHAEAAQIAFNQRDPDGLLYVQRRCGNDKTIMDKVNTFLIQLNIRI